MRRNYPLRNSISTANCGNKHCLGGKIINRELKHIKSSNNSRTIGRAQRLKVEYNREQINESQEKVKER